MISNWSYSKLVDSDSCKLKLWLKHDQRIPEPERPLPPGKTEHANDRGTRLHTSAEDYVSGRSTDLAFELHKNFGPQLDLLRVLHKDGLVSLEGEWAMTDEWEPVAWSGEWRKQHGADKAAPRKAKLPERGKQGDRVQVGTVLYQWHSSWHRCKLDAMVTWSPAEATVIDYKSGRIYGNEIKHGEQMQLYQLNAFLRYPLLETVTTELWYVDHEKDNVRRQTFTRAQGLRFKSGFDKRGRDITTRTSFPSNPNTFSCQWCPYGPWGTGHCQVGVKKGYVPGDRA